MFSWWAATVHCGRRRSCQLLRHWKPHGGKSDLWPCDNCWPCIMAESPASRQFWSKLPSYREIPAQFRSNLGAVIGDQREFREDISQRDGDHLFGGGQARSNGPDHDNRTKANPTRLKIPRGRKKWEASRSGRPLFQLVAGRIYRTSGDWIRTSDLGFMNSSRL